MTHVHFTVRKLICLVLMLVCLAPTIGCVGLFANFLNVVGAGLMPPAYEGLEGKKVAVVCVSNSQLFGPTSTSSELTNRINRLLAAKVKDIQLVPTQDVEEWIDENGWDMVDFMTIGRGVEAEVVIAIDVVKLSLHDGMTMFKGRADVQMVVYDMHSGQELFVRSPPQIELFLDRVASRLARNFYAFDMNDDVASDVVTMSKI